MTAVCDKLLFYICKHKTALLPHRKKSDTKVWPQIISLPLRAARTPSGQRVRALVLCDVTQGPAGGQGQVQWFVVLVLDQPDFTVISAARHRGHINHMMLSCDLCVCTALSVSFSTCRSAC